MTREFVRTKEFEKCWHNMNLNEQDLMELESYLCLNPEAGDIVKKTGGLRKLRWAFQNAGKSGGIRVVYVDFAFYEKIYFISAYPKSEKDNLSDDDCIQIKKFIKTLSDELERK